MFEISITDECIKCGEPLSAHAAFKTHEEHPAVWRVKDDYVKYLEPYPAWHHCGFSSHDGEHLNLSCNNCGAEYSLKTGPISLYCEDHDIGDVDVEILDAEEDQRKKETTFLAWLKNQYDRGDTVGDFAIDCFHAEHLPRGSKQKYYREFRSWPKRATIFSEWIKFLNGMRAHDSFITAFKIAWSEFVYLRKPEES